MFLITETYGFSPLELKNLSIFLHHTFLGMIKPYSQKDILVLINNGTCFDPRYITNVLPDDIKQKIRDLIKREPEIIKRYLNYTSLIKQCKEHRPDLYPLFTNFKYINWTNRMIRIIQISISKI